MARQGRLIVGTSGFAYDHWRKDFYAGVARSRWLESYAERFCSVELNVTFYRTPERETFRSWAERTPAGFEFAVKGSRTITHYRRLKAAEKPLDQIFSASSGLGEKLSVFLWQLPPGRPADISALERFCDALPGAAAEAGLPEGVRHAFEFRDPSWFAPEVLSMLRDHGYAVVDAYPSPVGRAPDTTAGFEYLRFHHGRVFGGGFGTRALAARARGSASVLSRGLDVYAFFNNDSGGWAPRNAEEFRRLASGVALPLDAPSQ